MYVFSIFFKTIVSIPINAPYNVFVKINVSKPKVKHPKKLTSIPFLQVQNQPFQARYVLPRFANISIKFQTLGEKKSFFPNFFPPEPHKAPNLIVLLYNKTSRHKRSPFFQQAVKQIISQHITSNKKLIESSNRHISPFTISEKKEKKEIISGEHGKRKKSPFFKG